MARYKLRMVKNLKFIPNAQNFSDLSIEDPKTGEMKDFDPSDDGLAQLKLEEKLEYEQILSEILRCLEPRDKIIFLYQILRDLGVSIDHGTFAKTLGMQRTHYMRVLRDLRLKTLLFIKGFKDFE